MNAVKRFVAMLVPTVCLLWCSSCLADQVTGEPGTPTATTSITGQQLPPPDPKFGGVIKERASESTPWWSPRVVPPKGSPNVLLIMTDDSGFGAPGTFGGVVPTPAMDRIAQSGLRYTNFHSTSLCSPSRAALITGRNHHVAGFGVVGEIATGFPGYDSVIRKRTAPSAKFSSRMATRHRGSARITTRHSTKRRWPGRSINGPTGWASSTSTASSAVTPASGRQTYSATRRRFIRFGKARMESDHGNGRRGDSVHEGTQ